MPIYEYKCVQCGSNVEIIRQMVDRDRTAECTCGGVRQRERFPGGHVARPADGTIRNKTVTERSEAAGTNLPTAIDVSAKELIMNDVVLSGWGQGVVVDADTSLSVTKTKFNNVKNPIVRRRS
jgi:putative FmdB family regulatory protein